MNIKQFTLIFILVWVLVSSLLSSPIKYIDDLVLRDSDSTVSYPQHLYPFLGILSYSDILFGWQTQFASPDTSYSYYETEKFLVNNMDFDQDWNLSTDSIQSSPIYFFAEDDGGFSLGARTSSFNVNLYSYHSTGIQQGNSIQFAGLHAYVKSLARQPTGQYLLASATDNSGVWLTNFGTDGTIIGEGVQVADYATNANYKPVPVTVDDNGTATIAWTMAQNGNLDIYLSRISNEGIQLDSTFRVNEYAWGSNQYDPCLSSMIGNTIIAWTDQRDGSINTNIYAQIYNPSGLPIGENFLVNDDDSLLPQERPKVRVNSEGNFVIQWVNISNSKNLLARAFTGEGSPVGSSFLIASDIKYHDVQREFFEPDFQLAGDSLITIWVSNDGAINMNAYKEVFGDVTSQHEFYPISNFALMPNYPNPFNPTTTISYELPEQSTVSLTVYDLRGQEVKALQDEVKAPGNYEVRWNGIDDAGNPVSTGVYFCRLAAGSYSETIKMVYLR